MVVLLSATIISCSDAISIINRVTKVVGLSPQQKSEIIQVIRKSIPDCPVKIIPNDRKKSNS
jgi:hypothetical protein